MLNFETKKFITKIDTIVENVQHSVFRDALKDKKPMKCKIIDEMQKIIAKKH